MARISFGNAGRNTLTGPPLHKVDFALEKRIPVDGEGSNDNHQETLQGPVLALNGVEPGSQFVQRSAAHVFPPR